MIEYLNRYYALGLVFALVLPLWIMAARGGEAPRDAAIWTAILLGCWLLMTKRRGFQVRGS